MDARCRIGTAGWGIAKQHGSAFPAEGSHLERYAAVFDAAEINSSFYRPHRVSTYERWAASVPERFRFSVKLPKTITHERRLAGAGSLLDAFLSEIAGLGAKLGPLLVQLPPSLPLERGTADAFLHDIRSRFAGSIVLEPRHQSWFFPEAEGLLGDLHIARVAADPPVVPSAGMPGGWQGLSYFRLHGSPRIYYSPYGEARLHGIAERLRERAAAGAECWCILDNTAAFAAIEDALALRGILR